MRFTVVQHILRGLSLNLIITLNSYFFFKDSRLVCGQLIAITYAWTDNDQTLAYFSVSNDAIARQVDKAAYNRASRHVPNKKRFTTLPAVKIGRLALIGDSTQTVLELKYSISSKTGLPRAIKPDADLSLLMH